MEERRGQLTLHALAQRQLAYRLVAHLGEREQRDELLEPLPIVGLRQVVDRTVELKRLLRRQIPHELLAVAEHEGDASLEGGPAGPGVEPGDLDPPARRVQETREHLERRGLAGPVGAEECDDLPRLDAEGHVTHRLHLAVPRTHERANGAPETGVPHLDLERLAEPVGGDEGRQCHEGIYRRCWSLRGFLLVWCLEGGSHGRAGSLHKAQAAATHR